MDKKVIVMGYHNIGCRGLKLLIARGVKVVALFSHHDDPKELCWFDSVVKLAEAHKIPVYYPEDPNTPEWIKLVRSLAPDVIFSFYYRKMLSPELLEIPKFGAVNAHGSLLPKYRGRSPVNWQIVRGETESGITLHYMVRKADAGDIVGQRPITIGPDDTAVDVFHKIEPAFEALLAEKLDGILSGTAPRLPQDITKGNYCGGRKPEDGKIIWMQTARAIHNLVRAVTTPYPGAFCGLAGKQIMIWKTKCSDQEIVGQERLTPGTVFRHYKSLWVKAGTGALQILEVSIAGQEHAPHHPPESLLKVKDLLN